MTFLDLSRYDVVGVDTETTGLSFTDRPVGCSIATPDGKSAYYAWGHASENNCSLADFQAWARKELGRKSLKKVFHNAAFDLRMLAYHDVKLLHNVEDTLIVAAILNELEPALSLNGLAKKYLNSQKSDDQLNAWCADVFGGQATRSQAKHYAKAPGRIVEPYAKVDAELTLALYEKLRPWVKTPLADGEDLERVYQLEIALIPILLKMHLRGVPVDRDKAAAVQDELGSKLHLKLEAWKEYGDVEAINSGAQLEPIFTRLGLPVLRTPTGRPSFTKEHLKTIDHPAAMLVRQIRALQKMQGTFIDNYIVGSVQGDGSVHCDINQVKSDDKGTVSGRFSSSNPNTQNLPKRDAEWAPIVRGLFIPEEGCDWLKLDYNSIEYRFFAHYAGGKMRQAYIDDPTTDFHQWVADLAAIPRSPAKTLNFAKLYGAGKKKIAATLGRSIAEAEELILEYDTKIPEAKHLYDLADRRAKKRGWIRTWGGRIRRFQRAPGTNAHRPYLYTHKGLNALLQGSAADLIKDAMVRVDPIVESLGGHLHLTVHDELDISAPKGEGQDAFIAEVKHAMEDYPSISVPIIAEAEIGPDWGHTTKWRQAA